MKNKKKGKRQGIFAVAAMVACAVAGRLDALTPTTSKGSGKTPAPAQLPVRRFHIVAGSLDTALLAYGQQSGVTMHVAIPPDQLATLHSAGLQGLYTQQAALQELLKGTGLTCSFDNAESAIVGLQRSDTVDVTAQLSAAVSMGKFTEDLLHTPQTVAVVPDFVLHDEQNRTLTDAVRNVPGISIAAGESGAQGDNLTIRGFTARDDIFLDGIRDFGSYYRDSFNYDQVEVLEGPAGVQFGRGSTGGVINQESKVPAADRFAHRWRSRNRPHAPHHRRHQRADERRCGRISGAAERDGS
ncbi:MAG TPA: TonB-dependent receptor plug domain-containing protein [Bryocella sp.]|nr:TonB-dependent receptor plug domain-containing protein [Bryocella sp.]